jgi:BirA family transcriptional regulator, biotin operon repressor / biotin---[acetyl-CoA-carboxylase] ligase
MSAGADTLFTVISETDSTNNYAMAKAHAGLAAHGQAYFTCRQTAGKGQRGKQWQSGADENIALSIVLMPQPLLVSQQFHLSVAVALGCYHFFNKYAGEDTAIKWPNDIYWRDRKAGGILIENAVGTQNGNSAWKFAIAGIGININQVHFDDSLPNPVSLRQITGKIFSPEALAKELHSQVLQQVQQLLSTGNFTEMLQLYNNILYKRNQPVVLKKGRIIFESVIKGVTENGKLFTSDTIDNFFDFGEVEWIR